MTSVDPGVASARIAAIRKQGQFVASGLAGLAALCFCLWFFNSSEWDGRDRIIGSFNNPVFFAVATVTCSFIGAVFWSDLSRVRPQFSWLLSVLAGVVAIGVAVPLIGILNLVVWGIIELINQGGPSQLRSFDGTPIAPIAYVKVAIVALSLQFFVGGFFGLAALIVAGVFIVPISVGVCLATTAWARWRLRREGLASYAFVKTGQQNAG